MGIMPPADLALTLGTFFTSILLREVYGIANDMQQNRSE